MLSNCGPRNASAVIFLFPADRVHVYVLSQYLPPRLLPGAAADECRRLDRDERSRGLGAHRHQDARHTGRDDVCAGLRARDDADVAVDGAGRAAPRLFMAGALINLGGCALAVFALWVKSFPLYCLATAVIGIYTAVGFQYRFAAMEVATSADRAKAISLVLAGGIVGGVLGPESARAAKDWFAEPFLGSFIVLGGYALLALAIQSQVNVPRPTIEGRARKGRPLGAIVRQPVFIVAALAGGLGYGLMNLLMTATPIAMSFCGHPFAQAAFVIEWHVVAMYAPGFFTGDLIKRLGVLRVILAGVALMAASTIIALNGDTVAHFTLALAVLGVGWNFLYTGGTTLLTEAYSPAERAKTQGANDFIVFTIMGVSSFSSGALVSAAGWATMNRGVLPFLVVVAAAVLWLGWRRMHAARIASGG